VEGYVTNVKINYVGDIASMNLNSMTIAFLKGLLSPILEDKVNNVNAMFIARERGINVSETKTDEAEDFAHLIHVEVETNKMKNTIMGTLFTKKEPRVVRINNFYVEALPKGHMLVIDNEDSPGIVGQIGTLLGDAKINIAGMTFGREKEGGNAITLLNVDSEVPAKVLEKIKKAKHIKGVKYIKL